MPTIIGILILMSRINFMLSCVTHVKSFITSEPALFTAQCDGRYKEALQRSQKCLSTVQNFTEEQVPNKVEVVANLYSCIGNAYLELGSYDKALESHQTDLSLGEAK